MFCFFFLKKKQTRVD